MEDKTESMLLQVNVPDRIIVRQTDVLRIVAESFEGFFGILPHRLDCIAPLVPGILIFSGVDQRERYIAVDEGVLVKSGLEVTVSVRSAVAGDDLRELRSLVEQEFKQLSELEQSVRLILSKIEDDFIRLYHEVHHE